MLMRIMSIAAMWLSLSSCVFSMKAQHADVSILKIQLQTVQFDVAGNPGARAKAYEELWQEGDSVAVWADSVALCYYHLISGAGKTTATFEGPSLRDSITYYASFPGKMPGDTLKGSALAGKSITLEHSRSFMRLSFKLPAGKAATVIGLMPMSVQPLVMSERLDSLTGSGELLLPFEPSDWSADAFAAMVVYSDNSLGTSRLPGMVFGPGKGVEYRFEPITVSERDVSSDIGLVDKGQERLAVSSGQYSGITYIEGTRYAVVHDKSNGGGIHFFDIQLNPFFASASEAPGNAAQKGGKDNEGIVYLPKSGTLLVSAEGDQSIREYDLEGNPTGRMLAVPADLGGIQSNAGFEALGYNSGTGLIWTVTEKPLKADDTSLLRIQSFSDETLEPAGRYLYLASLPLVGDALVAKASAYVFGIPAITALDDGRLIVLEREVYVPGGNYFQKAMGSFTRTCLYVVDPVNDKAGILQKQLLTSFTTGALNLANYEGMCLGPVLSDGSQSLLLIADSQGGQGGLTGEYIRILSLKP